MKVDARPMVCDGVTGPQYCRTWRCVGISQSAGSRRGQRFTSLGERAQDRFRNQFLANHTSASTSCGQRLGYELPGSPESE